MAGARAETGSHAPGLASTRARRDGTAPEGSTWRDFLTVDGNDYQTAAA